MVPANENNPVIRLAKPSGNLIVNSLIVAQLFEAKATVPGNDKQRIRQAVLDAQFENDALEIAVDIPGDEDLFCFWIVENLLHACSG